MANALFLYDCQSDRGALSGGSWAPALPLANLQNERLEKITRSADLALASTLMHVALAAPLEMRALALGPSNLTTGYSRRVRAWADSGRTALLHDSGWVRGAAQAPWNTLNWSDPAFWDGYQPWDDDERGMWLIYIPDQPVVAQYWTIEIDDRNNSDGHLDFGRLFMGRAWQPSLNYTYSGNGLSLQENSVKASTLAGGLVVGRRINPRVFRCAFDYLPEIELFGQVYDFQRVTGFDGQVFVIPDPEDDQYLQRRAFLSTATRMDALTQAVFARGGTAFEFREVI
ncbi:hypothetical protein [Rhizobium oryzicola]|uniref:Uncharacterized protein n=1 Tax=Rhizobium oryzicola TaxID=1232668 RepID=A0ABT8SVT6_9HYPH|nr:hypothetical protein [Rhizobium oryzicola]MDO1582436.1 hypothetical protein [Rhizobium oryzicola]